MSQVTAMNGKVQSRSPSRRSKRLRQNDNGLDDVAESESTSLSVHTSGEGAAGEVEPTNGDVIDAPVAGEYAASTDDVVVAPMVGEDASGIMNGDAVNSFSSSENDKTKASDEGTGISSESLMTGISSNIFGSGGDSMVSINRTLMAECNTNENHFDDDGDEDEGGEDEPVSPKLKKAAYSVFAPHRKVLFLMSELDGEECCRLQISPTCDMLVVFFNWCVKTNLNSTIVRNNGDTTVFGDEMFLVAVQAARAYIMKERGIQFNLNDSNNKSMMRSFSKEISAVLKNFHFMGTG